MPVVNLTKPLDPSGHRLQASYSESITLGLRVRGSVLWRSVPVAILASFISLLSAWVRNHEDENTRWWAASIIHPFAVQVFGIMFAFVVTNRVTRSLFRWWEGMTEVSNMQNLWHDALVNIMSYVKDDLQLLKVHLNCSDMDDETRNWVTGRIEQVTEFGCKLIHWFSLVNAIALSTLKHGEDQALNDVVCKHESFEWLEATFEGGESRKQALRRSFVTGRERSLHYMYLGSLSIEEDKQLNRAEEKTNLLVQWIYEALVVSDREQVIHMPSPVQARIKQNISDGLQSYNRAYRIAAVPYPFPLAQISSALMVVFLFLMPIVVEKFTQAYLLTPVLTFLIALGYWGLNAVAQELENPFGDDANDLPLREFCDTYIDRVMESNMTWFQEVRDQQSVHTYSQVFSKGILPVEPPQMLSRSQPTSPRGPSKGTTKTFSKSTSVNKTSPEQVKKTSPEQEITPPQNLQKMALPGQEQSDESRDMDVPRITSASANSLMTRNQFLVEAHNMPSGEDTAVAKLEEQAPQKPKMRARSANPTKRETGGYQLGQMKFITEINGQPLPAGFHSYPVQMNGHCQLAPVHLYNGYSEGYPGYSEGEALSFPNQHHSFASMQPQFQNGQVIQQPRQAPWDSQTPQQPPQELHRRFPLDVQTSVQSHQGYHPVDPLEIC